MTWFYLALIPPILFGITNYLDKIIISRYIGAGSTAGLFMVSTLISALSIIGIILFTSVDLAAINLREAMLLMFQGALMVIYLIPYFRALQEEEPSFITALFQAIPVFGLILEFIFLGTRISLLEFGGMLLIVINAFAISIEYRGRKVVPKFKAFLLMMLACLIISTSLVLFKGVGQELNFWTVTCYSSIGAMIPGIILLCFKNSYRHDFFVLMKGRSWQFYSWNFVNEILVVAAGFIYYYCIAVLAAPIALVSAICGLQTALVFLMGLLLTLVAPSLHQEKITRGIFWQKFLCIAGITAGVVLIALG